ncbi:MAG: rhomboid family intramembrane serine protease [Micropepsaceae bacterium]
MESALGPRPPWDESREPILRSPRIVTFFIGVFFIVHTASQFLTGEQYDYLIGNFALIPAQFESDAGGVLAIAPMLTYAFLHGDFVHLIFNSLWFLVFATAVARRAGTGRFLLLLLITTLGAAVVHLIFHWGSPVPVVGASGAVSGLMGAAFRFIFIDPRTTPVWPPARLSLISRPVLLASSVWIVLNIVLGVTGFTPDGFGRAIAWEAHIGGFLTGLLLFPLFDRQRSWIS